MELRERIISAIVSAEPRPGGVQMVPARSQAEAAADAILGIPAIREALELREERERELDALHAERERLCPTKP